MKIVRIEPQKRNEKRMNLYNEHGYFCSASAYVIKIKNIQEGKEYSQKEIEAWIEEDDFEKAKIYAVDYLLGKTEKTMRDKLKQKEYSETVIERTIEFLKKYQYVDDIKVGKAVMRDGVRIKKEGRNKIKQKLYQKGVKKDDIEEVINHINEDDEKNAAFYSLEKVKEKYKKKAKSSYEWRSKCYQYLIRKGFPYELASLVTENEDWTL